jgi:alpha-beta hydrolase superfamily lysophospholipase
MLSSFDPVPLRLLLDEGKAPEGPMLAAYRGYYGLDGLQSDSTFFCFEAAGYRIAAQAWIPLSPKGSLLLLHGYYDHMGLYRHLIEWSLQLGLAVIVCDLPGHGLSSGSPASIASFSEYQAVLSGLQVEAARLSLPAPWHLCGQSTGAAIVIDHLLNAPLRREVGRAILLAPLVRPRAWLRSRFSYQAVRPFLRQLPRRFTVNSTDAAFIDFVHRQDPLQAQMLPTDWVGALARWIPMIESAMPSAQRPLIVQGDADLTVDWRYNLKILEQKFDRPDVLLLPGARHHLANEQARYRTHYLDFLKQQLGL